MNSDSSNLADDLGLAIAAARKAASKAASLEADAAASYAKSQSRLPSVLAAELLEVIGALKASGVLPDIYVDTHQFAKGSWFSGKEWTVIPRFEAWTFSGILVSLEGQFGRYIGPHSAWSRNDFAKIDVEVRKVIPSRGYRAAWWDEKSAVFEILPIASNYLRLNHQGVAEIKIQDIYENVWTPLHGWLRQNAFSLAGVSDPNSLVRPVALWSL